VIVFPDERSISGANLVNESAGSVAFGLASSPAVAEEVMISRDLRLLEYTEGRIHFSTLSSAGAVELLRRARKQDLRVSADIAAHQLCFDDTALSGYDTNLKVLPPFRTREDIKALVKGLADDTIGAICSDHMPEDRESKEVEYEYARPGIAGIETAFAAAHTCLQGKLELDRLIAKFTTGPRDILGLPHPEIAEGAVANLTVFDPSAQWSPAPGTLLSRSGNTPFYGYRFTGKPVGIVNRKMTTL
jgi:dihydroorotase